MLARAMSDKVSLSFEAIKRRLTQLRLPEIDIVVGIATGGIVPAALVADQQKKPLSLLHISFRDEANKPRYEEPVHLTAVPELPAKQRILLVDDVAVTGATLEAAKALLSEHQVITLVFKGKADFVLFPEISACVNWPWKPEGSPVRLNGVNNHKPIEKEPYLISFPHAAKR